MNTTVVVIGGGIVGTSIARELSRYDLKGILVEKEADVASGTSKANTGIVHAGYDPEPGTVMAELNRVGNQHYKQISAELGVTFKETGSLVVANNDREVATLSHLKQRGEINGVTDLRIVTSAELRSLEPGVTRDAVAGLYAPTAGIVSPYEVTIANAETALINGFEFLLETCVTGFIVHSGRISSVLTTHGPIKTDFVVNAAGLYVDEVASMAGDCSFTIHPRRGEYMVLDKRLAGLVGRPVFPTPTPLTKGVTVTPTVDGNILIGPTSESVTGKTDMATSKQGLTHVFEEARRLVPSLAQIDVITTFSGLRATLNRKDFLIARHEEVEGFVNVAGIQSPGLTAAPAIALRVIDLLHREGVRLEPKDVAVQLPQRRLRFREGSIATKQALIVSDPRYGRLVCRCETVTEGDIVAAIHRPIGAKTLDGVKFRTRAGMGRCQGGFCEPRVIEILAREISVRPIVISKKGTGSEILIDRNRRFLGDGLGED